MSTVKITDLPVITNLDIDTANTVMLGVDISTDTTAKFTVTTLAEGLYHNNSLKVGQEDIIFANTIAQFSSSGTPFLQVNLQNTDEASSGDYVVTADIGTNANNFIDLGMNGSTYNDPAFSAMKALDGYLYVSGSLNRSNNGNLIIGTASANANVSFIAGGTTTSNIVAEMSKHGFTLKNSARLKFTDDSIQSVAAAPANYTQSAFNAANGANGLAAGAFTAANSLIDVNTTQNTNITLVNQYAASAYAQANATIGVNATQNTNITLVNQYAAGAFAKANAALANSTGIFGGSLTVSNDLTVVGDVRTNDIFMDGVVQFTTTNGNITTPSGTANEKDIIIRPGNELGVVGRGGDINLLAGIGGVRNGVVNVRGDILASNNITVVGNATMNGTMVLANSSFSVSEVAFRVTAAGSSHTPTQAGTLIQLTGKANTAARMLIDSFGNSNAAYSIIAGRSARGTVDAPTATQNNDILLRLAGNSYGTTGYAPFGAARIEFIATENQTDTARGSKINFYNTANGSNVINQIASFNGDSVHFTGTVAPAKGFIYTPLVYPSAQTGITIDFANNSMVRAQTSTGLVVAMSNYTVGKIVELWITNTSGTNQTYTTGISAINSTLNSTTYTIPGTSTICARYFCVDGTLANTLVSVIHA